MKTKLTNFFMKFFSLSNWDRLALLGIGLWLMIIIIAIIYKEVVA